MTVSEKIRICVVDRNDKRRAAIENGLSASFEVTAVRDLVELSTTWPEVDAAFVSDEHGNLTYAWHTAVRKNEVLPVIAFGERVDSDRAISAIYSGAIDCIDITRHRRDLAQRVKLALSRRAPEFAAKLKAMRSVSELARLDRSKRAILGLFASGKGSERISRELGISEAELEQKTDEIRDQLRLPSFKHAVRMMIDYFR